MKKITFILITLTTVLTISLKASQKPKEPINTFDYYCTHYLHIDPKEATSEQENYYLDVFTETDEYLELSEKLDSINATL